MREKDTYKKISKKKLVKLLEKDKYNCLKGKLNKVICNDRNYERADYHVVMSTTLIIDDSLYFMKAYGGDNEGSGHYGFYVMGNDLFEDNEDFEDEYDDGYDEVMEEAKKSIDLDCDNKLLFDFLMDLQYTTQTA